MIQTLPGKTIEAIQHRRWRDEHGNTHETLEWIRFTDGTTLSFSVKTNASRTLAYVTPTFRHPASIHNNKDTLLTILQHLPDNKATLRDDPKIIDDAYFAVYFRTYRLATQSFHDFNTGCRQPSNCPATTLEQAPEHTKNAIFRAADWWIPEMTVQDVPSEICPACQQIDPDDCLICGGYGYTYPATWGFLNTVSRLGDVHMMCREFGPLEITQDPTDEFSLLWRSINHQWFGIINSCPALKRP